MDIQPVLGQANWDVLFVRSLEHFCWTGGEAAGVKCQYQSNVTMKNTVWLGHWLCAPEEIGQDAFAAWCPQDGDISECYDGSYDLLRGHNLVSAPNTLTSLR